MKDDSSTKTYFKDRPEVCQNGIFPPQAALNGPPGTQKVGNGIRHPAPESRPIWSCHPAHGPSSTAADPGIPLSSGPRRRRPPSVQSQSAHTQDSPAHVLLCGQLSRPVRQHGRAPCQPCRPVPLPGHGSPVCAAGPPSSLSLRGPRTRQPQGPGKALPHPDNSPQARSQSVRPGQAPRGQQCGGLYQQA